MERQFFIVIGISLAVVMPTVFIMINIVDKRRRIKSNSGATLSKKSGKVSLRMTIYQKLSEFPATSGYLDKLRRQYEITFPGEPGVIMTKTIHLAALLFLLNAVQFAIIYGLKPSLNNLILVGYLIFVFNHEIVSDITMKADIALHESLKLFLSDVGHYYLNTFMIDDAILEAMKGKNLSPEMKAHAKRLYDIIISTEQQEDVIKYNMTMHNKFMKMFLSLCISIMEYDNVDVNGNMLLSTNIFHLKREIELEVLKIKKLRFIFSGSVFVTIAGCFFINAIQKFGISIMPELGMFYQGRSGILFIGLIFFSSMIVYVIISNAKDVKRNLPKDHKFLRRLEKNVIMKAALDNFIEKNYGRVVQQRDTLKRLGETLTPRLLMIKQMVGALLAFSLCIGLSFFIHQNNRNLQTQDISNIENLTTASSTEQSEQMAHAIVHYVKKYKDSEVNEKQVLSELTQDGEIYNTRVNEAAAAEIVRRIRNYQKEYYKWYELLICLFAAVGAYFIPYLMIRYRKRLLSDNMKDEINQFNSIIYMQMYVAHITVMDLLEQMEMFALVFKSSLRQCINDYNSGEVEALTQMMENETYDDFRRLVENLIKCDSMPIYEAFKEIASDRETQYDERKFENEKMIQKRADNIKPLSFIPVLLILVYLILPVTWAGMKELLALREMIAGLGF